MLVVRREADGERVDIALNTGREDIDMMLEDDEFSEMEVLFTVCQAVIHRADVTLGGGSAVVVRRY